MKTILVDVDSVIADIVPVWLQMSNDDYQENVQPKDIRSWAIHEYVSCGMAIYDYIYRDDFYDLVKPMDGARSAIGLLRRRGHRVLYVTSGVFPAKVRWMSYHGFLLGDTDWAYAKDVVIAHDKSVIKGDILIDDYSKNCDAFDGTSLLYQQPWNEDIVTGHTRVADWAEITAILDFMMRNS